MIIQYLTKLAQKYIGKNNRLSSSETYDILSDLVRRGRFNNDKNLEEIVFNLNLIQGDIKFSRYFIVSMEWDREE